jgi:heme exporter protein D
MSAVLAGKYAPFIGSAYAVTAVVFLVMILAVLGHARRWRKRAETLRP